jgi:ABC-type amino acid transport substrate-binding protein
MRFATFLALLFTLTLSCAETIKIGTTPFSPPFIIASDSNGNFSGFDADLLNEICRRLDIRCEFQQMSTFQDVFVGVLNNTVNLGIGGITITSARETQYIFSLPYLKSSARYMSRYGSDIHSLNDIAGKTIGVTKGTIFELIATSQFGDKIIVRTYDDLQQMLVALAEEDLDVVLMDGPNAEYWYANSDNTYQLVGPSIPFGLGYGFMANLKYADLIANINKALLSMEKDGSYLKIYNTYFGG